MTETGYQNINSNRFETTKSTRQLQKNWLFLKKPIRVFKAFKWENFCKKYVYCEKVVFFVWNVFLFKLFSITFQLS